MLQTPINKQTERGRILVRFAWWIFYVATFPIGIWIWYSYVPLEWQECGNVEEEVTMVNRKKKKMTERYCPIYLVMCVGIMYLLIWFGIARLILGMKFSLYELSYISYFGGVIFVGSEALDYPEEMYVQIYVIGFRFYGVRLPEENWNISEIPSPVKIPFMTVFTLSLSFVVGLIVNFLGFKTDTGKIYLRHDPLICLGTFGGVVLLLYSVSKSIIQSAVNEHFEIIRKLWLLNTFKNDENEHELAEFIRVKNKVFKGRRLLQNAHRIEYHLFREHTQSNSNELQRKLNRKSQALQKQNLVWRSFWADVHRALGNRMFWEDNQHLLFLLPILVRETKRLQYDITNGERDIEICRDIMEEMRSMENPFNPTFLELKSLTYPYGQSVEKTNICCLVRKVAKVRISNSKFYLRMHVYDRSWGEKVDTNDFIVRYHAEKEFIDNIYDYFQYEVEKSSFHSVVIFEDATIHNVVEDQPPYARATVMRYANDIYGTGKLEDILVHDLEMYASYYEKEDILEDVDKEDEERNMLELAEVLDRADSLELVTFSDYWNEWDASNHEHRKTRFINSFCASDEWCFMNDEGGCCNIVRFVTNWKLNEYGLRSTRIIIAVQTVIDHYSDTVLAIAWFVQGKYIWFGLWLSCNFLSTVVPGCVLLLYGQPLWIALPMFIGMGMMSLIYKVSTSIDESGRKCRHYRKLAGQIDSHGWKAEIEIRNNYRLFRRYQRQLKRLRNLYNELEALKGGNEGITSNGDRYAPELALISKKNTNSQESRGISSFCLCFRSSRSGETQKNFTENHEESADQIPASSPQQLKKKELKLQSISTEIECLRDEIRITANLYRDYQKAWIAPYESYLGAFNDLTGEKRLKRLLVFFQRECTCLAHLTPNCHLNMFKGHNKLAIVFELLEQNYGKSLFRLDIANIDQSMHNIDETFINELKASFLLACKESPWLGDIEKDITVEVHNEHISWSSRVFAEHHIHVDYTTLRNQLSNRDLLRSTIEYNEECLDNMKWIKSQLTQLDRNLASILFELNFPDIYKLWEVTTESLPQLFLQIYVLFADELSSSKILGYSGDTILYVSLLLSFTSNVLGTTRMFEPRGFRMLLITIFFGAFDTAWRGFSLCIPLSNSEYPYVVTALILIFTFINGLILGNFFIRRTELQFSHGLFRTWFGSFFLGGILFLCATPVIFLVSSSGVDPSVSFVNWASSEAIMRLISGLILMAFNDWKKVYLHGIITIICGLISVALFWSFPVLMHSIPRNNILLDPFGDYQQRKANEYGHNYMVRQKIEVYSSTAGQWLPGFVSGYGSGENGQDLSRIIVIYKWEEKARYYQKEIYAFDKQFEDLLRPKKLNHVSEQSTGEKSPLLKQSSALEDIHESQKVHFEDGENKKDAWLERSQHRSSTFV